MKPVIRFLTVPFGAILSGMAAVQAASALGHGGSAGYPFPDLWGAVLFVLCAILAPSVAAVVRSVANRILDGRNPSIQFSLMFAMLVIAPQLGMTAGFIAQSKENHRRQSISDFDAARKRAYRTYANRLMADPGIASRD